MRQVKKSKFDIRDALSRAWRTPWFYLRWLSGFGLTFVTKGGITGLHWRQRMWVTALQTNRLCFTERQIFEDSQKFTTGEAIAGYCKAHGLAHEEISLGSRWEQEPDQFPPGKLHFVKSPAAGVLGPTLVYVHGGGYLRPIIGMAHMPLAMASAAACGARQVVFLEYSLSTQAPYPSQLNQMVKTIQYLMSEKGISSLDLILEGDSAGGHLIASMLAHIVRPSPYAPELDLKGSQFRAIVLLSPWLNLMADDASCFTNEKYDYACRADILGMSEMFQPKLREIWANPSMVEEAASVWDVAFPRDQSAKPIAQRVLVTAGGAETLFDSCAAFGTQFVKAETVRLDAGDNLDAMDELDFVLVIGEWESHVQLAIDAMLKYDGATFSAVKRFLSTTARQRS